MTLRGPRPERALKNDWKYNRSKSTQVRRRIQNEEKKLYPHVFPLESIVSPRELS